MISELPAAAPAVPGPRPPRWRAPLFAAAAMVLVGVGLSGCLAAPASVDKVEFVATKTIDGWKFDQYRNKAYPCSISGYQTFVIGTKVGLSPNVSRPLWVKMRGGGAGWFDSSGTPQPTSGNKSEESFATSLSFDTPGLMEQVKAAPEHFRLLLVSMCSHDVYSGNNTPDPHNPNTTPDGKLRPTTGLAATKAAVQYATAKYPTSAYFLNGTSAGGAGSFSVGWALQQQGLPPTGIISDSGVINQEWELYVAAHGISGSTGCGKATDDRGDGVLGRIDPEIGDIDNEPDRLVATGRLTVPVLHVWNRNDQNSCGNVQIPCPMHDGTTVTMGASECRHGPIRNAILAQGPSSRSKDMEVCVEGGDASVPCDRHVVTAGVLTNSDTTHGVPADFTTAIMDWVRARMADG
ncbi:hypothetical protein [Aquihabitans sp. McL0605]|uniref:hypothetical protein n=1 Tax=Aquihabitans sp. McL0605 TaxID=3415671 RepID=UPI003CF9910E